MLITMHCGSAVKSKYINKVLKHTRYVHSSHNVQWCSIGNLIYFATFFFYILLHIELVNI